MTSDLARYRYGDIVDGTWGGEINWCRVLQVPPDIAQYLINVATGHPTERIYCNRDFAPLLLIAFSNLLFRGCERELHTFDGCFSIRDIRGLPGRTSAHSYGIAIDLNAKENPLGGDSKFSPEFVKCFTDAGMSWGGTFERKDPMHFSMGF